MIAAQTRAAAKFVDSLTRLNGDARQIGKVVAHDAGLLEAQLLAPLPDFNSQLIKLTGR